MINKAKLYRIDLRIILGLFLLSPILAVINLPGKNTLISLLFIGSYIYYYRNQGFKIITFSFPLVVWFVLTIYHWANAVQKNVPEVDMLDLLHGLKIFSCIAIFAYLARRNLDVTVKSLLICFNLYLLLSFFVNDVSSSELGGRMTGAIYATGLGQTAALTGIYIAYYSLRNNFNVVRSVCFYILPIAVILLTQSRNAIAMLAIGIIGHAIAYSVRRGGNLKNATVVILIVGVFSFFTLDFVISNTAIGERLANTESAETMNANNDRATNTAFDKIAGDRLVYYVLGWQYFEEAPLTGIGMWNYRHLTQGEYPLHSEYMVHLTEGGIIAALLWVLFIITLVRGIIKSDRSLYIKVVAFFSVLEILFCALYARVFFSEFFYPIIGIAISLIFWQKTKPRKGVRQLLNEERGGIDKKNYTLG